MAERLIDRYLPHYPNSAKDAFLRLAGNYQQQVSENLLKAWGHELEAVDPAAFEIAVRKILRNPSIEHFPRWASFAQYLPDSKSDAGDLCWYDAYTGERGGPWPEVGADLSTKQREHLTEIRVWCLKLHGRINGGTFDFDGLARVGFIDYLGQLLGAEIQEALAV